MAPARRSTTVDGTEYSTCTAASAEPGRTCPSGDRRSAVPTGPSGAPFAQPTEDAISWRGLGIARPALWRFTNSGTESTMEPSISRAITGRDLIIKVEAATTATTTRCKVGHAEDEIGPADRPVGAPQHGHPGDRPSLTKIASQ